MLEWHPDTLMCSINAWGPYAGAGIRVMHIAEDATEVRVEMPLTEHNRNLVGTHYGGSLYSMIDPHLMILMVQRLGPEYVVWDRTARIDFLRPGVGTVSATIRLTDEDVERARAETADGQKYLPEFEIEIVGADGEIVALAHKTLYVRRKRDA